MIIDHQMMTNPQNPIRPDYRPDVWQVYILLIGFCIENMIKGILLHLNPDLMAGGKLSDKIKNQDLKSFVDKLDIEISEDEKQFLDFLTPNILWFSRYPIPTNASNNIVTTGNQIESVRNFFLNLFQKLS